MQNRVLTAIVAFALALPAIVSAQEAERGPLFQVITWEVQPDQMDDWKGTVEKIVAAAEAANLSADYKWAFWSSTNHYTLVYPIANFAYFDDPDQWLRQFAGTPGDEMVKTAFAEFANYNAVVISEEISERKAAWGYQPAGASTGFFPHIHLDNFWIRPGQDEAFDALIPEFMAMFEKIGYAYPIFGHMMRFGDTDRAVFVTAITDDLGSYYGPNSLEGAVAAANAGAEWGVLVERLQATIRKWKHSDRDFEPSMTYWPMDDMTAGE